MRYPEMVKTNARYRGPMESRKHSNGVLDVLSSLEHLRRQMRENNERGGSLRKKLHDHYIEKVVDERKTFVAEIQRTKGGDM